MVFDKSVIAPVVHKSRPITTDSVPTEFDEPARMLPWKLTFDPSVDDAKIAQKTFLALAPLIRRTWASLFTVSDDPIWKIQTAFASPWPSRMRVPPTAILIVESEV